MTIIDFTVEEVNMIAIYKADTLTVTLTQIADAVPDMDADMRVIVRSVSRKLATLSEPEFSTLLFSPADETGWED